jgi:hypothetical protein
MFIVSFDELDICFLCSLSLHNCLNTPRVKQLTNQFISLNLTSLELQGKSEQWCGKSSEMESVHIWSKKIAAILAVYSFLVIVLILSLACAVWTRIVEFRRVRLLGGFSLILATAPFQLIVNPYQSILIVPSFLPDNYLHHDHDSAILRK